MTIFQPGAQCDNRLSIVDTDRDSLYELIFLSRVNFYKEAIWFYEQTIGNPFQFQLQDSIMIGNDTLNFDPWAIGDADCDGLSDMIGDWAAMAGRPPIYGARVYESADSFSFPKNEVWRDTVQYGAAFPMSAYDIDQDGFLEFINNHAGPPNTLRMYEAIGDNQYDTVFTCDNDHESTYAFGDFDLDGKIEFVAGNLTGDFRVYESSDNNQYECVFQSYLPTGNIFDCLGVPDADNDGRPEFIVKGVTVLANEFEPFIFEAIGNNTYQQVASFSFDAPAGPHMCFSDAGDVDGDDIPEIVVAAGPVAHVLKAVGNDSFIVMAGFSGGDNIRVRDLDHDGDCEIITSGLYNTIVYNYVPPGVVEEVGRISCKPAFGVFPSPCYGVLEILRACATGEMRVTVFNVLGKEIMSRYLPADCKSALLDVSNLAAGIYFVQLQTSMYRETRKVCVLNRVVNK